MAAQSRRRQHNRRRAKRRAAAVGPIVLLIVLTLSCGVGYAYWHTSHRGASAAALDDGLSATTPPPSSAAPDTGKADSPSGTPTTATTRPTPSRTTKPPAKPRTDSVPQSGTGSFSTAHASGSASGQGTIRRYKVEVEGGIDLAPSAAAQEISGILADPRGWTADGHDGFQLVSSGSADFVIKIATPDTVDSICGAAGLLTHGEVNCDVGSVVVVNLKRWMLGSPEFHGPIGDYRALIINHEVGHRIGHGHEGCPGPGKPAPVMMQQIYGLHGCTANQWPYDSQGRYIRGPSVP